MPAPKGHAPYNKNGEGGRPKKWNGEKIEELAESLDQWIDKAIEKKDQFWWWDWCYDVGLDQTKVSNIARENERFRKSYDRAKNWQESIVARFALTKKFSEGFSKFLLTNHYPDKWAQKDKEISGENDLAAIRQVAQALRDLPRIGETEQSAMALGQPLLHQGQPGEQAKIPNELGAEGTF